MASIEHYSFKKPSQAAKWLKETINGGNWRQETLLGHKTTYFDTFDWRLFRQHASLQLNSEDRRKALSFHSFSGDIIASLDDFGSPDFVWNMPAGSLQKKLEPHIKMRRLLPLFTITSTLHKLALLNNKGKIILRVQFFDNCLAKAPDGIEHKIQPYLQAEPVEGFQGPIQSLRADKRLRASENHSLNEALAAIELTPANYSSKINIQLNPSQNAEQALRTILLDLLSTLKANLEGTCSDLDSEFLHDFRVAVRRTRSALSQLKGILPPDELAPFKADFSWLGTITGPTRDLDVYLLKFKTYQNLLPEHQHRDLVPFLSFLMQRQKAEQKTMAAALASKRFLNFLSGWQDFLERKQNWDFPPAEAKFSAKDVADRRIWKLYKRCLKEGNAIDAESPAEALHELRKTCKKLRYLLEFFQSLYPRTSIKTLIKSLKVLQDNLGDFQDYQVQGEAIRSFGIEMAEQMQAPPATLLAMGALADRLLHKQQQTRTEFDQQFKTFSRPENHQVFQKLFATGY